MLLFNAVQTFPDANMEFCFCIDPLPQVFGTLPGVAGT